MALEQESRLAFNVAAKWTDRVALALTAHGLRIAFGEIAPGETKTFQFHSAIMMSYTDAALFKNALDEILQAAGDRNRSKKT